MPRFNLLCFAVFLVFLSVASAVTMNVTVGGPNGELTFSPANFTANVGDTINFVWAGGQHSVMLADSVGSCTPSTKIQGGSATKSSGSVTYVIDGKNPKIWYYCGVGMHCAKGMFGTISVTGATSAGNTTTQSSANRISGGVSLGVLMVAGAAAFLF
ncbi:19720_t:CDS:2 [Cetraspora pellucida]|uniref:19720_t:CDS:1 n=1 Tax=Cetraspora pellucida TaxID=1433469 RepID=A0A9N9JSI2_9GLOM|nr:19720_t:CDS:2 [Cetraspora pellucida]